MRLSRTEAALFLMVVACVVGFAAYTNNAWEDWYITYRASKNLATGNGLVFQPGQRIHSFTSPLGTLVPAGLNVLARNSSDDLVLWLYRGVSALFLGATGVILLRIARNNALGRLATVLLVGCFLFDGKTATYSINGMETAFLVFFVALTVYTLMVPTRNPALLLGVCWGGLMWTRPDGFVYAAAMALGFLLFPAAAGAFPEGRKSLFQGYLRAAGVGILLYLPWLLWAWSYYGTPVPHTIVAKGLHRPPYILRPERLLTGTLEAYGPPYFIFGGWGGNRLWVGYGLLLTGLLAWLARTFSPVTRALSVSYLIVYAYMFLIVPFASPWYLPSVCLLGFFAYSAFVQELITRLRDRAGAEAAPGPKWAAVGAGSVLLIPLIAQTALWFGMAYMLRNQQAIIEDGHRRQIGLWLKENAKTPNDTIMMECLGYFGYFSGLKTYDYPGMSSPEMVAARRQLTAEQDQFPGALAPLMTSLRPDWVILRPEEAEALTRTDRTLLTERYVPAKEFDVCQRVRDVPRLPGRDFLLHDCRFTVYRRLP